MRKLDANLISFLKQLAAIHPKRPGFKYNSFEEFYLKKGHLYPHAPYTDAEEQVIFNRLLEVPDAPTQKQCFYNAQKLAMTGELSYAEGYVLVKDLPIALHHAWAVYKGKPVDVTIRRGGDVDTKVPAKLLVRASENLSRASYFGVAFPRAAFLRVWHTEGIARAVIEDYKHNFPLLRGSLTNLHH